MRLPILTLPSTGPPAEQQPPKPILVPEDERRYQPGVDNMQVDKERHRFNEPEKKSECPDRICENNVRNKVRDFSEVFCEELFRRYSAPFAAGATTSAEILNDQRQLELFAYVNAEGRKELLYEIGHAPSFRRNVAGQQLVAGEDAFGKEHIYVQGSPPGEDSFMQTTFWNERTVAPPADSPNAPTERRCEPRVCLVPLESWADRVLQEEEAKRDAFRLDKLLDGMCELMGSAYHCYRTAYTHGPNERHEWIRRTTALIRLLGLYLTVLPDLAFSLASDQDQKAFSRNHEQLLARHLEALPELADSLALYDDQDDSARSKEQLLVTKHMYEACDGPYEVDDDDDPVELWPSDLKTALEERLEKIRELVENPPDEDAEEAFEPYP